MSGQHRILVRRAETADVDVIRELAREAYRPYVERIGREPAPMSADYGRAVEAGRVWVAEHDGRVVGLLVLESAEDHLMLENIAVLPRAQGVGVGRRLLQLAEERARDQGLSQVRLYTNEAMSENLAYYPRRGYYETHRGVQHGYRRVFFAKDLVPSLPAP